VSARVRLRAPTAEDGDALLALARESRAAHRGLVSPPITAAELAAYLRRCRDDERFAAWLVRPADGDVIVGQISLERVDARYGLVGFWLGAAHVGRGHMSEALGWLGRHARDTLRLDRLEAEIQPENTRAVATVGRAGFRAVGARRLLKIEGAWRDHHVWSLTLG